MEPLSNNNARQDLLLYECAKNKIYIFFYLFIKKNLPRNCPVDLFDQEIHHQMINDELYDRFDDFYFSDLEYREPVDHLKSNFMSKTL